MGGAMGWGDNGMGGEWDRGTMGWGENGMGGHHWDGGTMGWDNGMGGHWDMGIWGRGAVGPLWGLTASVSVSCSATSCAWKDRISRGSASPSPSP